MLSGPACAPRFPPIVTTSGGKDAFLAQVSQLHPVGTSGAELRGTLEQHGFKISLLTGGAGGNTYKYYHASLFKDGFMAACVARVQWKPDRDDAIAEYLLADTACAGL